MLLWRSWTPPHSLPTPSRSLFFPPFKLLLIWIWWYLWFQNLNFADKMGFQGPTTIQAQAIPVALSGRHLYPWYCCWFRFSIFFFFYHFYFIDIVFWKLPLWFLSFIILLFLYDFYEYLGFYVEAFKSLVFCAGIIPWQLFVTLCYLLTKLLLL